MPTADLAPLAQRMDVRFDELVERLTEQLPTISLFYAALPTETRRSAAVNLYKVIRDSVEEGGIDRYAQAITQIGRTRIAQGGSPDDLRAATDLIRQLNLSLLDDIAHTEPSAAAPAFAWLDRLAAISLQIFTGFAQESLARQAEDLDILTALSERMEQAQQLSDIADALFEQLPRLNVDWAIISSRISDDPPMHESIGVFDAEEHGTAPPAQAPFSPDPFLKTDTPDAIFLSLNVADLDLAAAERERLFPARVQALEVFPLRGQHSPISLLILGYRRPHQFAADEQRFLALLSRMLRNRIANLRLIQRLQEQVERATIFQALVEGANDMILLSDTTGTITYANAAAARLLEVEQPAEIVGQSFDRFLSDADRLKVRDQVVPTLTAGRSWSGDYTLMTAKGTPVPAVTSSIPLRGPDGAPLGVGGITRDERERLALIESLRRGNDEQQHMLELLRQLSTPLVPVMAGILVMPLVGDLDSRRAGQVMETLLQGVTQTAADIVILDITGVPLVDTAVANALVQAARAVRLLGAEALLVGITPEVAQALVGLGVDLRELVTRGDLQSGIAYALRRRGYRIVRNGGAREQPNDG